MAAERDVRIAVILWDTVLDCIEELLHEKCVCCRVRKYYEATQRIADIPKVAAFAAMEKAHINLQNLGFELHLIDPCPCKLKGRPTSAANKWIRRKLELAEARLLVAIHYHPLIHVQHICFLPYATVTKYGLDVDYDATFMLARTMDYVSILCRVRNLFE
jgi:hypothetical protein